MPSYLPANDTGGDSYVPKRTAGGGSYISDDNVEPEGPPSLWGQFQGILGALPSGIGRMGADIGQDAYALTQLPSAVSLAAASFAPGPGAAVTQGIHRNRWLRPFFGEEMVVDAAQGQGFSDAMRRSFPFMASMGTSMRMTGERAVNQGAALAPGGLPAGEGAYARASREGTILPTLIEDIGNAAIVTSLASRGVGRVAARGAEGARAAEAVARGSTPLETGGATAARSRVTPAFRGEWWERPVRTARQTARLERELTSPAPDVVARAAGGRLFEVGSAGPSATTARLIDDAATAAARTAADTAAARALRWSQAERALHTTARFGDALADAPARIFTWPAQQVIRRVGPVLADTTAGQAVARTTNRAVGGMIRRAAERREGRRTIHEAELTFTEGAGNIRLASIAAERVLERPEEGMAGLLAVSGVADAIWPVITRIEGDLAAQLGIDPAQAREWAVQSADLGDDVTPELLELAHRYSVTREWARAAAEASEAGAPEPPRPAGILDPDEFQRIDTAQQILREEVREPRGSRYFRAWGESRGPRPDEETAGTTEQAVDEAGMTLTGSARSAAADEAARQQQANVVAGRVEQRGAEPLSVVVDAARDKLQPKIDAAIRRVLEAQDVATRADSRRLLDSDAFKASVVEQVRQVYADAQQVAQVIVEQDPVLARAVAAPDPRISVSDDALVDLLAGRLVSARGSRNPQLRQLMKDLKEAGYEVPFDVPDPRTLAGAERRAATAERARIFGSQARAARAQADNATAQREAWEQQPQRVVYARDGATSQLEARTRALDLAQRMQAEGPNAPDADLAVREARRAAAAAAFGVEVRPGEAFRVPRDRVTGEQADPTPLGNTTDADGNYRPGMLADIDMRGGELHPVVNGITEVTPGRFMQGERVWIAYNGEGRAVGYLATYGDGTGLSIAVDPAARGQGIGLRLYEAAEQAGMDVHAALADEQFTDAGARLYERYVNGPAEGLAVTYDRPVQRRVFETAADKERRLEAAARREAQGEQGQIEVPAAPPQPRMVTADGDDIGPPPPGTEPGSYLYDINTGELRPIPEGGEQKPEVRSPYPDPNGMPDYWHAVGAQDTEPGVFDGGAAARERFMRAHPDLPFDAEEQNIIDQWADKPAERSVRVRITPRVFEDLDERAMAQDYEGPANPYLKITEAGQGGVNLTESEARELLADAEANAEEYGPNEGNRGMLQAYTLLAAQLRRALDNGDAITRADADKLLTKPQAAAVLHVVETSHEGWPADGDPGIPVDDLRASIEAQIEIHLDNQADGQLTREGARELKALQNAKAKLDTEFPPPAKPTLDPGQLDRMVFNATIYRHFDDIYGRGEPPRDGEVEVTVRPPDEAATEAPALADEPLPANVTDPELNQRLDQHLAEFQQAGERALYDLEGEWEANFGEADYLQHLPRQAFVAGDAQRVPTEWEWFVRLPQPVQRMIRERYMAPDPAADARRVAKGFPRDPRVGTGSSPDEITQFYRGRIEGGTNANVQATVEEAMGEYVRLIQERDVLERATNPRARASDAELEWAAERMGMDPEVLKALRSAEGGRSRAAMLERLAEVVNREQAAARMAEEQGPPPPPIRRGQVAPWEMTVEDYAAELTEMESRLAAWADQHPVGAGDDVFDEVVEPADVIEARQRLNELAPRDLDYDETPAAPDVLHERLVRAAEQHGVARTPDDIRAEIRDWSAAWSEHATNLQRVREQMHQLLVASDELRSTPIDGIEAAARGLPADHPIRRYADLQREEQRLVTYESELTRQNVALNNALRAVEARQAAAPEPSRIFDPAARGQEAVADVEQRALEAFIEDAENRRVARLSGQKVPKEDLLYNDLNEPARRIYRQMVRDSKVVTEEARLELARRQLGQKLIAQGRRAQAPISRQEGRLVARERILQSSAEVAERRVNRALDTLEAGPSQYEARTTSLERSLGRFGTGQRKIGVREGEARARELDLGTAERNLVRLLDRQAEAERQARVSSAAAPARFAAELRAANNLRAAIEAEADWLDEMAEPGAGDLLRSLTAGIPQSVFDAVRAGGAAADPEHLIGGTWGRDKIGAALGRLDESLPYVRRTGQERIASRVAGSTQFDVRGQAIEEIKRYKDGVRNELSRQMQERFGVRADDLGVDLRGRELVEAMKDRGFVPWDPRNPLDRPPASQVTGQTTFLPQSLYTAFKRSTFGEKPRWQQNLELWYDRRFLGTLKTGWLALSPRWQIGNLVGNSLMAVIGGGVDPITLVTHMREARAMLREDPTGEALVRQQQLNDKYGGIPRELLNRGMTHEEMAFLNPELDRPVRNPAARLARRSYALNEFTDNVFRSAVYLAKAEPRVELWNDLEAGRISPEQFMARVGNTLSTRQALDGALHAAGDFQNLTPWERNVIKRLWIFYPWYRHITRLALTLPINHPTRVLWTLHVAQLWGDEQEQAALPPFLRGSIPLGNDRYLRTGQLNPFGQVEDSPLLSPGSAIGGLTPAITWPAAILMGVDLTRGGAQISRPPGTERLDAYGRPTNTPLWRNPRELGRYLVTQFPQGRAALGTIEDPVLRYGQGSPVLVEGETVPTGTGRASGLATLFGIPLPATIDTQAITDRRQERRTAAAEARRRYDENLRRATAGR